MQDYEQDFEASNGAAGALNASTASDAQASTGSERRRMLVPKLPLSVLALQRSTDDTEESDTSVLSPPAAVSASRFTRTRYFNYCSAFCSAHQCFQRFRYVCLRSNKRTSAALRESLRRDCPGGSRRLRSTLAAAPVLFAHAVLLN
jgi:hypothetical protein